MKKKLVLTALIAILIVISASVGAYAATKMTLIVNGKKSSVEPMVVKGVTYVPLRAAAEMLGAKVKWDPKTSTVTLTSGDDSSNVSTPSTNTITIKDVTITLNKVIQDSDSLRLFVTYTNNSGSQAMTGDSLAKVVASGKQYEYISGFNFDRYYNKTVDKAPDFIEPGVTANSVIFFEPIDGVKTINVVLKSNFELYRFNDVTVVQE